MKAISKRVACYVRVSTVGQNEAGQRAEIEHWLTGNGIDRSSVMVSITMIVFIILMVRVCFD